MKWGLQLCPAVASLARSTLVFLHETDTCRAFPLIGAVSVFPPDSQQNSGVSDRDGGRDDCLDPHHGPLHGFAQGTTSRRPSMAKRTTRVKTPRTTGTRTKGGETHQTSPSSARDLTTNQGTRIADNQNSLRS